MTEATAAQHHDEAIASLTAALDYVHDWLGYRVWKTRLPGAQVAVWFDGRLQFNRAYGTANVYTGEALTTEHRMHVASHSKTFAATAALQLVESGRLRLDDTVGALVPELAKTSISSVTLRELMGNGAGIVRDTDSADFWELKRPFLSEEELFAVIEDGVDILPPSTRFKYTNIGWSIVGSIIERAGGASFDELTTKGIMAPLGLKATTSDSPGEGVPFSAAHTGLGLRTTRDLFPDARANAMASATGFCSTAADMVRFGAAQLLGSGELLDDHTKRMMRQAQWRAAEPQQRSYCLGLIEERIAGVTTYGHSGGWPGQVSRTFWHDESGIVVSVLHNAVDGTPADMAAGVFQLLQKSLERPRRSLSLAYAHAPERHPRDAARLAAAAGEDATPTAELTPKERQRFAGRYSNKWGLTDIVELGETLYEISPAAPRPSDAMEELEVVNATTLRSNEGSGFDSVGELLRFDLDDAGRVRSLVAGGSPLTPWDGVLEPYRQTPEGATEPVFVNPT